MISKDHGRIWLYLAIFISSGQVALIWLHRFVPVIDYPNWLFQAKIIADLAQGGSTFGHWYAVRWLPVPNATFTIGAALLGQLFTYEVAGKIILSISVLLLPWGVWFAAGRFGAETHSAVRYFGFPFGLNMFTLSAQNYTLALGMLVWLLAIFLHPTADLSRRQLLLMAAAIAVLFLTHGAVYCVLLVLLFSYAFRQPLRGALALGAAVAPSALLGFWYAVSTGSPGLGTPEWGWTTFARHLVKPACLFLKSHVIVPLLPPSFANVVWLAVVGVFITVLLQKGRRAKESHHWLAVSGGVLLASAFVLPDFAFGIVQPGARVFMPALFLLILSGARSHVTRTWNVAFAAFCIVALVYNTSLFARFNERATELTEVVQRPHLLDSPVYVISMDWAENAGFNERIAPSINGLSFVPIYELSKRGRPYYVFETGLITMKDSLRGLYPELTGSTLEAWVTSTLANPLRFAQYNTIILFGDGPQVEAALAVLSRFGFTASSASPGWRLLTRPLPRVL